MAITVKISTLFGTHLEYQFEPATSIFQMKDIISNQLKTKIHLYLGNRELNIGSIESNNIKNGDQIKLISDFRAGFSPVAHAVQKAQQETLKNHLSDIYKQIDNVASTIDELYQKRQELESHLLTPLEELDQIRSQRDIAEDDYECEDMRILFKRCRNQIEEEGKKMEQTKKENECMKRKLECLRNKMQKRKRQMNKINDNLDDNTKDKLTQPIIKKHTFGGFTKGFLL
jgi:chromosome segregation ATPase